MSDVQESHLRKTVAAFLKPMVSHDKNPIEQIPVMGLFLEPDICIEVDIDSYFEATSLEENPKCTPRKSVSLSKKNPREVVFKISLEHNSVKYFVGHAYNKLNKPEDAEFVGSMSMADVLRANIQFQDFSQDWLEIKQKQLISAA